jgi:hypothetical protein
MGQPTGAAGCLTECRDYCPGDLPVVEGASAPFVPEVPAPGGVVDDEVGGVLGVLDAGDVLLLEALALVSVELPVEPDMELLVLGGVLVSELVLGGVDVVPGLVVLDEDELLGVEPELPLPLLLQPVAATEASAMTATRGIRRFMTSSPISSVCVEEIVGLRFRDNG